MVRTVKKTAAFGTRIFIRAVKIFFFMPAGSCRYYPSCSEYAAEAMEKLPVYRALPKIVIRVLRCNPFSHGGFDPVIKTRK